MELFEDIEGSEGKYQITSWGRVYNVDTGRFLKPDVCDKGYLRVDLIDRKGKRTHHKVHRLVGKAFLPNPEGKPQIYDYGRRNGRRGCERLPDRCL